MNRIIIRTQIVQGVSSKIIQESTDDEILTELNMKYGKDYILQKVFGEKISYREMLSKYNRFMEGEESHLFAWMYMVAPDFGIVVDNNIYLYHYDSDIYKQLKTLFPWAYMDSKKYMGDTWWSSDSEILDDMKNMSVIDFLSKYIGY